MKKIFLPLLALVGMVAGFTLCSCGGGGGDNDGPARALAGAQITEWISVSPALLIDFGGAVGPLTVEINSMSAGGTAEDAGLFFMDQPIKNPDGTWRVTGSVNLYLNNLKKDSNFLDLVGAGVNGEIVSFKKFILIFDFPDKTNGEGTGEVFISGYYKGGDNDTEQDFQDDYPDGTNFRFQGFKPQFMPQ